MSFLPNTSNKELIFSFNPATVKIEGKPIIVPNQHLTISWEKHFENIFTNLNQFLRFGMHTDVTIIVQGKKFRAHRIILSTASGYFHGLLKKLRPQHTEIHFGHFTAQNIEYILQYIYEGKCSMKSENLDKFMQTARLLQIYSLSYDPCKLSKQSEAQPSKTISIAEEAQPSNTNPITIEAQTSNGGMAINEAQLPNTKTIVQGKLEENKYFAKPSDVSKFETLLTLIRSNLDPTTVNTENFKCFDCDISFSNRFNLIRHRSGLFHKVSLQKTKNLKDKILKCPLCEKNFYHRNHLIDHYRSHDNTKMNPAYRQFLLFYLLQSDTKKQEQKRKRDQLYDSDTEVQQFIVSKKVKEETLDTEIIIKQETDSDMEVEIKQEVETMADDSGTKQQQPVIDNDSVTDKQEIFCEPNLDLDQYYSSLKLEIEENL